MKENRDRVRPFLILTLLLIIQIFIFGTHVGKGFVTDDFNWLENVVFYGKTDLLRPFTYTTGFFRPLVGISFGIQYTLHGMNPLAYGLFNLFLHLSNIILVYLVISRNERLRPLAPWAAVLFALNAKAVTMAVCWVSGRTTLMFSFFMLLSLYTFLQYRQDSSLGRRISLFFLTGFFYLAALLSKETAMTAPIFVFFFSVLIDNSEPGNGGNSGNSPGSRLKTRVIKGMRSVVPFSWPLVIYFVLRSGSDAFTPLNAPQYYRYSFAPGLLLRNISEYVVRSALLDIYILVILVILAVIFKTRKNPSYLRTGKGSSLSGLLWYLCFLLPVLPLACRSDLYVYFPQIGLHVVFLSVVYHSSYFPFLQVKEKKGKRINKQNLITAAALIVILVFWTGYLWAKADIFCKRERSSAFFTKKVVKVAARMKKGSRILIIDMHPEGEFSPSKTVSHGLPSLLNLYYPHKRLKGEIIPIDKIGEFKDETFAGSLNFTWKNNRLRRISGKSPRVQ